MALWDHKLELRARRGRAPWWSAAFAASAPAGQVWLSARLTRRRVELRRGIARELARPRPDLGLLRRLTRDLEAVEDRLAAPERGGRRPCAARPDGARPPDGAA